jgi:hypothetical protein
MTDGEREQRDRRDTDRLWASLDDIRQAVTSNSTKQDSMKSLLEEVRADLKNMAIHGCAKAAQHDDHETRLRSIEREGVKVNDSPKTWQDAGKAALAKSPMAVAVGVGMVAVSKPLQILLLALVKAIT